MERKQGCEVTFSPVKTRKQKRESAFLLPDYISPIYGFGYKIIDCYESLFLHQGVHFIKVEPFK